MSERHKYWIRLYDDKKGEKKFKKICIDDYIPCNGRTRRPVFARPKGNEIWVLLLEKAFAKFNGSYGKLQGGREVWAFKAMTGNKCFRFDRYPQRYNGWFNDIGDGVDNQRMWKMLKQYDRNTALIAASRCNSGRGGGIHS